MTAVQEGRKLASVREVRELRPIPNADRVECAVIDGWEVVTQKGWAAPSTKVVYFEVDSYLPVKPEFEFLRKTSFRSSQDLGEGFRLKTVRLRGQLSQGLIMPLHEVGLEPDIEVGTDLTERLGVRKYEKPLSPELRGMARGHFPSFLRKTDQERIQNCYNELRDAYADECFECTRKLDGSSMTVYFKDGVVGVCSRNLDLVDDVAITYWRVARETGLIERMSKLGGNFALQGELIGPGVNGNNEGINRHEYHVFDVWDIDNLCYLDPQERWEFFAENLEGLDRVEHVWVESPLTYPFQLTLAELLETADGRSTYGPRREGVVYKPHNRELRSFKVISNAYLEGEED